MLGQRTKHKSWNFKIPLDYNDLKTELQQTGGKGGLLTVTIDEWKWTACEWKMIDAMNKLPIYM